MVYAQKRSRHRRCYKKRMLSLSLSLFLSLALKVSAFIRSMAIVICFDMGRHA
jgi:hypothetical protein